tara:strand:- start:208144 stop:208926 length:783 start_codon:yes stop_codon:yes gene_type:complete
MMPSVFISHGAPDLPLANIPARAFTQRLAKRYQNVTAILVISAHWEARVNTIGTADQPATIYDFGGFDRRLYEMTYPAHGSQSLVNDVVSALKTAGFAYAQDRDRGYDHGVWVPLRLAWPDAKIPVVQLSLRHGASAAENVRLGAALAPLRQKGVLIIGSGASVHNLRAIAPEGSKPPAWAVAFDDWLVAGVVNGDYETLVGFPHMPKSARVAHPSPEHLMPFYVAFGAGSGQGTVLHRSFSYGSLGMTSFEFGADEAGQ